MKFTLEQINQHKDEVSKVLRESDSPLFETEIDVVGSIAIAGEGSDLDLLVYTLGSLPRAKELLLAAGYERSMGVSHTHTAAPEKFASYRKGDVNVLLTYDEEYQMGFLRAVEASKYIANKLLGDPELLVKEARIILHRIIRDGRTIEEAQNGEYDAS